MIRTILLTLAAVAMGIGVWFFLIFWKAIVIGGLIILYLTHRLTKK